MEDEAAPLQQAAPRAGHVKKRALKNKALAVPFNEKDLKDYVGGFHKRKKKRRKEARKQQDEALRRKRLELRAKRKLEREYVQFGAPPTGTEPNKADQDQENNEEGVEATSTSGTTMYDNGNLQVTVTTSEITHEDENIQHEKIVLAGPISSVGDEKHNLQASKSTSFKKVAKHKSRSKMQTKRDKRKAKTQNSKKR